MRELIKHMQYY